MSRRRVIRRPVSGRWLGAVVLASVLCGAPACSTGSSSAPTTSSTTTATTRTGPPTLRVLGDGTASAALPAVAAALGAKDVVDRSVPRSSAVSWLDIRDTAAPDEGSNHAALAATLLDAPSLVLVSLGGGPTPSAATDPLLRQQVMAVVFDLLAHTSDTRVVVVGSGGAAGSTAATVDQQQSGAVAAVVESGASWADRVAWAPSPSDVVTVLQQREWI